MVCFEKYFTTDVRSRLRREFMRLRQGDVSVAKFVQKFDRGCHFVPLIANDAAEKLRHFLDGRICPEGVATNVLLDSEATHSFISESSVIRLKVSSEQLLLGFRVMVSSGEDMLSFSVVRDVELEMQAHLVRPDLIVLLKLEFNIILGTDWLAANGASIEFFRRTVHINPVCGGSFLFEAAPSSPVPCIISCLSARKLMIKGCQDFLASVVSIPDTVSRTIEGVEDVKEFPDVFPKDITDVPPEREVEFSIDLISVTVPISKAPYQLAHIEMKS
ncbi:uncharacterized protein LOC142538608 [Primulina tabacum]|uniref:uncharacterized protein LOC142538608 n=1 Tax=Primulina tabacum TaxID=48773 RepID=UPI003F593D5F